MVKSDAIQADTQKNYSKPTDQRQLFSPINQTKTTNNKALAYLPESKTESDLRAVSAAALTVKHVFNCQGQHSHTLQIV
jgi:hypothetical protein